MEAGHSKGLLTKAPKESCRKESYQPVNRMILLIQREAVLLLVFGRGGGCDARHCSCRPVWFLLGRGKILCAVANVDFRADSGFWTVHFTRLGASMWNEPQLKLCCFCLGLFPCSGARAGPLDQRSQLFGQVLGGVPLSEPGAPQGRGKELFLNSEHDSFTTVSELCAKILLSLLSPTGSTDYYLNQWWELPVRPASPFSVLFSKLLPAEKWLNQKLWGLGEWTHWGCSDESRKINKRMKDGRFYLPADDQKFFWFPVLWKPPEIFKNQVWSFLAFVI